MQEEKTPNVVALGLFLLQAEQGKLGQIPTINRACVWCEVTGSAAATERQEAGAMSAWTPKPQPGKRKENQNFNRQWPHSGFFNLMPSPVIKTVDKKLAMAAPLATREKTKAAEWNEKAGAGGLQQK